MYRVGEEVKSGLLSRVSAKSWHSSPFFHPSISILTLPLLQEILSLPSSTVHRSQVFLEFLLMHDSSVRLFRLFMQFA